MCLISSVPESITIGACPQVEGVVTPYTASASPAAVGSTVTRYDKNPLPHLHARRLIGSPLATRQSDRAARKSPCCNLTLPLNTTCLAPVEYPDEPVGFAYPCRNAA